VNIFGKHKTVSTFTNIHNAEYKNKSATGNFIFHIVKISHVKIEAQQCMLVSKLSV